MSIFRSKAEQVYAQGALERGEFTPTGAPKRVYQYWASHAKHVPKTENFCHFWRVVVFWAPLAWLREKVANLFSKSKTWYAIAAVVLTTIIALSIFVDPFFIMLIVAPYISAGVICAGETWRDPWSEARVEKPMLWTAPISYPAYFALNGIHKVDEDTWFKILASAGGLLMLTFVGAALIDGYSEIGWWVLLWALAAPVAILALIAAGVTFSYLIDKYTHKRAEAREARRDAYWRGEISREEYYGTREPSRVALWLRAKLRPVGEFILLFWNIVRVNKWKICPIVKIDA